MDIKERIKNLTSEQRALLITRLTEVEKVEYTSIPRRGSNDNIPLSSAQTRFWFLQKLNPDNPVYNIAFVLKITRELRTDILEKSINSIIRRHEILRTSFPVVDGIPFQKINKFKSKIILVVDLNKDSPNYQPPELSNVMAQEAQKPFELDGESFLKIILYKKVDKEYNLLIITHHLVADGWSIRTFVKELVEFYTSFINETLPNLPELSIQYADYSIWQKNYQNSEQINKYTTYWRKKLEGAPFVLDLPTDHQRLAVEIFEGSTYPVLIPKEITRRLRALSQQEGVTIYITLLAAFQTLLHRYSRQDDLLVGTAVVNINRSEIENLIGSFSNNIILRAQFFNNPSFIKLLKQVRETLLGAHEHQDLSFEKLLEIIQPERDLSRNPLFQVAFILHQGTLEQHLHVEQLHFDIEVVDLGTSRFDLTLELNDDKDKIVGFLEYNEHLFDRDTIQRMVDHFLNLLESIVENPNQAVSELRLLTDKEETYIIKNINNTKAEYSQNTCIHQLFESQAEKMPGQIAVEFEDTKITYRQLNERSNQFANYLIKQGVKPDDFIGICIERSIDMIVGLLGILKAGGAYVPMDPSFPPNRLCFMLEDANIQTLITQQNLIKIFPEFIGNVICIDKHWDKITTEEKENTVTDVNSENLAYVIYTSGSTGKPKGVLIPHKPVVNFLLSMQKELELTKNDHFVSVTTISFDIAVLELFLPIITGAKTIIASRAVALDGVLLMKLLRDTNATIMQATPSTWRLLIEAGWNEAGDLTMLCGGEVLPRDLANQLLERGKELWNMYGPTETTIWSSVKKIDSWNGPVLIGPPIANTQFYILDKKLKPVPAGVGGELLIGGDGLAQGYLNRPELTKERFVRNPFTNSGTHLYRTGDLARFRSSGDIEFLGRLDFQVKVRGFRIELGEIENILSVHPNIKEVIVVAWNDENGDKRLVAYIIPFDDQEVKVSDLREFLEEKLPEYMIPSLFVTMDKFPLTPNAKIDRKSLPDPDKSKLESESKYITPRDELELRLEAIWQKALGVKNIGINDNFFELGGHSLLAAKLFAQIEKKLGKNLPLATLFLAPTIEKIADILRQKDWKPTWASLMPIQTQGAKPPLFLIHGAEGNVLLYKDLSYYLGENQPVYGLQSQGLDGSESMQTKFESMAENYIKEIKSVQPEGPYYLGGYCLGGTIALEIAQQLKQQGDEIALLAMLETYNIQEIPSTMPSYYKLLHKIQNLKFYLDNLLLSKSKDRYKFFKKKATVEWSRYKIKINITFSTLSKKLNLNNGLNYHHLLIDKVNDRAHFEYKPKVYNGKITLFRPEKHFAGLNDLYFGWGKYALKGVEILNMPVKPRGCLNEPFVRLLAEKLRKELENANTKSIDLN